MSLTEYESPFWVIFGDTVRLWESANWWRIFCVCMCVVFLNRTTFESAEMPQSLSNHDITKPAQLSQHLM